MIFFDVGGDRSPIVRDHASKQPGNGLGNNDRPFRLQHLDRSESQIGKFLVVRAAKRRGQEHQRRAALVDILVTPERRDKSLPCTPIRKNLLRCENGAE